MVSSQKKVDRILVGTGETEAPLPPHLIKKVKKKKKKHVGETPAATTTKVGAKKKKKEEPLLPLSPPKNKKAEELLLPSARNSLLLGPSEAITKKQKQSKFIAGISKRRVTHAKRRAGLFKKAMELQVITGARVLVVVQPLPTDSVFTYAFSSEPSGDAKKHLKALIATWDQSNVRQSNVEDLEIDRGQNVVFRHDDPPHWHWKENNMHWVGPVACFNSGLPEQRRREEGARQAELNVKRAIFSEVKGVINSYTYPGYDTAEADARLDALMEDVAEALPIHTPAGSPQSHHTYLPATAETSAAAEEMDIAAAASQLQYMQLPSTATHHLPLPLPEVPALPVSPRGPRVPLPPVVPAPSTSFANRATRGRKATSPEVPLKELMERAALAKKTYQEGAEAATALAAAKAAAKAARTTHTSRSAYKLPSTSKREELCDVVTVDTVLNHFRDVQTSALTDLQNFEEFLRVQALPTVQGLMQDIKGEPVVKRSAPEFPHPTLFPTTSAYGGGVGPSVSAVGNVGLQDSDIFGNESFPAVTQEVMQQWMNQLDLTDDQVQNAHPISYYYNAETFEFAN